MALSWWPWSWACHHRPEGKSGTTRQDLALCDAMNNITMKTMLISMMFKSMNTMNNAEIRYNYAQQTTDNYEHLALIIMTSL